MPVYDTPINTDSNGLPRLVNAGLPVMLYLYSSTNSSLDEAFNAVAKADAGQLLVAKIDASAHTDVHAQYGSLALPALVTLDGDTVESEAANIRPADVEEHADFLMGRGPKPTTTVAEEEAAQAAGTAPVHVSDDTFMHDVLKSDMPVLVDFWAPWCAPCHMIAPTLEQFAQKYAGRVKVAKLNVDENQQVAADFRVTGIPMLLMFKDGRAVGQLVGAHPPQNIEALIQKAL